MNTTTHILKTFVSPLQLKWAIMDYLLAIHIMSPARPQSIRDMMFAKRPLWCSTPFGQFCTEKWTNVIFFNMNDNRFLHYLNRVWHNEMDDVTRARYKKQSDITEDHLSDLYFTLEESRIRAAYLLYHGVTGYEILSDDVELLEDGSFSICGDTTSQRLEWYQSWRDYEEGELTHMETTFEANISTEQVTFTYAATNRFDTYIQQLVLHLSQNGLI